MPSLSKNTTQVFVAKVINSSSGVIRYDDDGETKDFRANRFKGIPEGTILRVVFSTSKGGRRWLMNVREVDEHGNAVQKDYTGTSKKGTRQQKPEAPVPPPPPDPLAPEMIDGFYFDRQAKMLNMLVSNTVKSDDPSDSAFIWLKGQSGYGKTSLPKVIAEMNNLDFHLVPCAMMSETTEWFGVAVSNNGTTSFEYSEFTRKLERGRVLILLDEANRIRPWIANSLLQLLDDNRQTEVQGHVITVGENVIFAMTTNIGYEYTGTDAIDAAFKNRVTATIEVGPLPPIIEVEVISKICGNEMAVLIVKIITALRTVVARLGISVDVSTRTSKNIAKLVYKGLALDDAFTIGVVNATEPENRKALIDAIKSSV